MATGGAFQGGEAGGLSAAVDEAADVGRKLHVLHHAGNFRRVLVSIPVEVDNPMSTPRALE